MRDTGDGTPFAACDHSDPCRLVTMGNYFPSRVDIDFVRQIACDHEDLFFELLQISSYVGTRDSGEKGEIPTPSIIVDKY